MKTSFIVAIFLSAILFTSAGFSQNTLVDINGLRPLDLKISGFQLDDNQKIKIEAVGLHQERRRYEIILGTCWILNSATREVLWHFEPAEFRGRNVEVDEQNVEIDLKAGNYEVYYSTYPYFENSGNWHDSRRRGIANRISDFFARLFNGDYDRFYDDYDYYDDFANKFKIIVKGNGKKLDASDLEKLQNTLKREAAISLNATDDDQYLTQGFQIKKPVEVNIYAIGEARDDGNFDYGWIINTETREKIWTMDYWESERAGGADKNRLANESVSLPAGRYAAVYVTDDSHSPREWNSAVPYDPAFWGMTVNLKNYADKQYFSKFDYQNINDDQVLYSLIRMRDDDFASKAFTLKKPMSLRIYAVGEGRDGEMFDYAWIVDANTHKKVWQMDYYDTDHAGGAQKNRLIDQVVSFDRGNYIAYYATDDSHSYREWNASSPYDPEHWGITILASSKNFSRKDISNYQEKEDKNILASIVHARDDEYAHKKFTLKKDSEVRIYAIGEGMRGEMYDYGWIEDANSGRVMWEMSYRRTDYAGGARKNRMSNDTISLKEGDYEVFYESDDSHSFNNWNDTPPWDPLNWGITVSMAERK
jgi:hypothetical protein